MCYSMPQHIGKPISLRSLSSSALKTSVNIDRFVEVTSRQLLLRSTYTLAELFSSWQLLSHQSPTTSGVDIYYLYQVIRWFYR